MGNAIPFSLRHMTPSHTWAMLQQSFFCGKPKWSDVPDLSGQVIIVTGGNAGIGMQTVKVLLQHNAKVYMASRNPQKAAAAIEELYGSTGKLPVFLELDLADLASVKSAATEFLSKEKELHVLYNNGGIMAPPIEEAMPTGYDLTFATNVLGHFYLTKLLLPTLISTAHTTGAARIVTITSMVHYVATVDYTSFKDCPIRRNRTPFDMYAQSKWADAVLAMELGRRYGDQGIVSMSVNPGSLKTNISHSATGTLTLLVVLIFPVAQLWAGTAPETAQMNGKVLDFARKRK
ncbi:hypothetical protein DFH07DRAFT_806712 [Mycena maculata]|uniref:NAD(P)-binding protein n=1 Tax=Mycena maculata TaxID=230809 RepID=A0AAD7NPM2_9AGAR|nr:hypothetical protein DFH07DRAFT_806712 [Mycena maculata]